MIGWSLLEASEVSDVENLGHWLRVPERGGQGDCRVRHSPDSVDVASARMCHRFPARLPPGLRSRHGSGLGLGCQPIRRPPRCSASTEVFQRVLSATPPLLPSNTAPEARAGDRREAMRTMIIAAVAAMGLASGAAYADGGEGPAANTPIHPDPRRGRRGACRECSVGRYCTADRSDRQPVQP
jgi:hypothetical protein